jgi:hypothetical protein
MAANNSTRVYFKPVANFNGLAADVMQFAAWDQTSGSAGSLADTQVSGGTTAYSLTSDTVNITVNPVNGLLSNPSPSLPVVIDLNRDGELRYGQVTMDVNGDGALDVTKWAGAQDGVLVWDKFGDGLVHDNSQYAFAQYDTDSSNGATDLSGLADKFDTNLDGLFNSADTLFADFKVWQDANQNGVSDDGEVKSLADWGITEINLVSDGVRRTPAAGVFEAGRTTATATDGSTVLVADAAFEYHTQNLQQLWGAQPVL